VTQAAQANGRQPLFVGYTPILAPMLRRLTGLSRTKRPDEAAICREQLGRPGSYSWVRPQDECSEFNPIADSGTGVSPVCWARLLSNSTTHDGHTDTLCSAYRFHNHLTQNACGHILAGAVTTQRVRAAPVSRQGTVTRNITGWIKRSKRGSARNSAHQRRHDRTRRRPILDLPLARIGAVRRRS
jgi:hypothetical protein